jgi:hypothetical protein
LLLTVDEEEEEEEEEELRVPTLSFSYLNPFDQGRT